MKHRAFQKVEDRAKTSGIERVLSVGNAIELMGAILNWLFYGRSLTQRLDENVQLHVASFLSTSFAYPIFLSCI